MRAIPRVEYKSPDQIDAIADKRKSEALKLPPGMARQSILLEAQRLHHYAMMKRVLAPTIRQPKKASTRLTNP